MNKIVSFLTFICLLLVTAYGQKSIKKQDLKPLSKKPNIFFFFADDWGKYASAYQSFPPNKAFTTPTIDKFAKDGVQFNNAHVNSPSCTPCRSSLLSGQQFYRTGLGAVLMGEWDLKIPSYPLILEKAGYYIGYTYKVWGPGSNINAPYGGKRTEYIPAGVKFNSFSQNVTKMVKDGKSISEAKEILYKEGLDNFRAFMKGKKEGNPFCYWFGPTNTHRKWTKGSGKALWNLNPDNLKGRMPAFLPDVPEVRQDMTDYMGEVLALDEMLKHFLKELDATGQRENTIIVLSGDHGIPGFPRAKANLYPFGTDVSLFVQWPGKVTPGRTVDDFVDLIDLAPTFLQVAGQPIPKIMTGRSIIPLLTSTKSGQIDLSRDHVVNGRERHVPSARVGLLPYPQRAIENKDYLYIRNFKSDREPMGYLDATKPEPTTDDLTKNTFAAYADFDSSPTKAWMVKHRNDAQWNRDWLLGFGKRPSEELYDLKIDPDYLNNVANDPKYAKIKEKLAKQLMKTLKATGDPRVTGDGSTFDKPPYLFSKPEKGE